MWSFLEFVDFGNVGCTQPAVCGLMCRSEFATFTTKGDVLRVYNQGTVLDGIKLFTGV